MTAGPSARRHGALIVGTFAVVGAALGVVGFVTAGWARTQFVTGATGTAPATFGPVFVALSVFQTTVTLFLAGPVVAALLGLLSGSRFADEATAGSVAAGGTLLGFCCMAGLGILGLSALSGAGTEQTYALGSAVGPLLLASVATAATGGVAGVLGSRFVR
ncbi:hypothetical protein [Haloplanus halobius]|uniref:hypothetical protein n=1 Tax=Haloplanus halobius TaxID=2934938 RepID=UPI00200C2A80|nr:hypothetical protein [Haloplanus sp. XH21]